MGKSPMRRTPPPPPENLGPIVVKFSIILSINPKSIISGQFLVFGHGGMPSQAHINDDGGPLLEDFLESDDPDNHETNSFGPQHVVTNVQHFINDDSNSDAQDMGLENNESEFLYFLSELESDPIDIPSPGEIVLEPLVDSVESDADIEDDSIDIIHIEGGVIEVRFEEVPSQHNLNSSDF